MTLITNENNNRIEDKTIKICKKTQDEGQRDIWEQIVVEIDGKRYQNTMDRVTNQMI